MGENSAKVVIKGDASQLVKEAEKGKAAVENVGKAGAGAAGQFQKMAGELGKNVARALALKMALKEAFEAFKIYQEASAKANKDSGKSAVERDLAAARLGLSSSEAAAITSGGNRTRDESLGFLSSLASGDNAKMLDKQGVFRANALFNSGLFSQEEVMEAAKGGRLESLFAESGTRSAALSPRAAQELSVRAQERAFADRAAAADDARDAGARLAAAHYAARAAESPKSAAVLQATGMDAVAQAIQGAIDGQTQELLQNDRRPQLAPGAR